MLRNIFNKGNNEREGEKERKIDKDGPFIYHRS